NARSAAGVPAPATVAGRPDDNANTPPFTPIGVVGVEKLPAVHAGSSARAPFASVNFSATTAPLTGARTQRVPSVARAGAGCPAGRGGGAAADTGGGAGGGTMVISCQVARPSTIELPAATGF